MPFFSQFDDLDRNALVTISQAWNIYQQNLGVNVSTQFLDFDGLLPEVNDVNGVLEYFHDACNESFYAGNVFDRDMPVIEGELRNVVIKSGSLSRQPFHGICPAGFRLGPQLLISLRQCLPVV